MRLLAVCLAVLAMCAPVEVGAQPHLAALFTAPEGDGIAGLRVADGGSVHISFSAGGAHNQGSIVRRDPDGTMRVLHSFGGAEGGTPADAVTIDRGGALYGTTTSGAAHGFGSAFKLTQAGELSVLHAFTETEGGPCRVPLLLDADGGMLGVTFGVFKYEESYEEPDVKVVQPGAIFKLAPGGQLSILYQGIVMASGGLTRADNGDLIGVTPNVIGDSLRAPPFAVANVYRLSSDGHVHFGLRDEPVSFDAYGEVLHGVDGALYGVNAPSWPSPYPPTVYRLDAATGGEAGRYVQIAEGIGSHVGLVQGSDGHLYTAAADAYVRVALDGTVTRIRAIDQDITAPTVAMRAAGHADFFVGSQNSLIGLSEAGAASVLARFGYAQGHTLRQITMAPDGSVYGVTREGGKYNLGALFRLNDCGLETVYALDADNSRPLSTALIAGADGAMYAVMSQASSSLIRLQAGKLTTLHTFENRFSNACRADSSKEALVQGQDGAWYGSRLAASSCDFYPPQAISDVYRFDPSTGEMRVLTRIGGVIGALQQAADGRFYGIRMFPSDRGYGNGYDRYELFRLTSAGELTVLHDFASETDGLAPTSDLLKVADGNFYGTAFDKAQRLDLVYRWTPDDRFEIHRSLGVTMGERPSQLLAGNRGELYVTGAPSGWFPAGRVRTLVLEADGALRQLEEPSFAILQAADGSIHRVVPLERDGYTGLEIVPLATR